MQTPALDSPDRKLIAQLTNASVDAKRSIVKIKFAVLGYLALTQLNAEGAK